MGNLCGHIRIKTSVGRYESTLVCLSVCLHGDDGAFLSPAGGGLVY